MMKRVVIICLAILSALLLVLSLTGLAAKQNQTTAALPERPPTFDELMDLANMNRAPDSLIKSYIYSQPDGVGYQNIIKLAQTGDTSAELMVCYLLIAGLGVQVNKTAGYSFCEKAAAKGSGPAKSNLIYRDYNEGSFDKRWKIAFDAFNDLMDVDPGAAHRGLQFLHRQNHPKASTAKVYYHLEQSVKHKNTGAMITLSRFDLGFYGQRQINPMRAEKNLTAAYRMNDFHAGHTLALEYRNGRVIEQDIEKYASMIKHMARFLHPESMGELGYMHSTGKGAVKDQSKANALFKQAAKFDDVYSQKMISHYLLFGPMKERDYVTGVRYLERQAERGNVKAMTTLADHYARLEIEDPNNMKVTWLSRAALHGDTYSQGRLGFSMMDTGYIEAMQPYIQVLEGAQKSGDLEASYLLARHYRAASGVVRDLAKAQVILEKVAHLNDPRVAEEVEIIESYISHFGGIENVPEKVR